jgi:hypothetical protein
MTTEPSAHTTAVFPYHRGSHQQEIYVRRYCLSVQNTTQPRRPHANLPALLADSRFWRMRGGLWNNSGRMLTAMLGGLPRG